MSEHPVTLSLGAADRRDLWWIGPLVTALILSAFGVYATWAAAQNQFYSVGLDSYNQLKTNIEPILYLSPFYSPLFKPDWLPMWLSPAFLILGAPLGFRATCYYYRKAYYRAFFFDPPACAVGEGKGPGYRGERAFPFILQNLHRFFLYLAIAVLAVLWIDVVRAFNWNGHFGMGLGTLVLMVNTTLLSGYTLGCHSLRHLVGGKMDCFSCHAFGKQRHQTWRFLSWFNGRHMLFAWTSLFSVGLADLYVRLVAMEVIHDIRFF